MSDKINTIPKKRSQLSLGDIIHMPNLKQCCKLTKIEEESQGISYGDTYNYFLCEEVNDKFELIKNGKQWSVIIGFSAELGNEEYNVVKNN